MDKPPLKPFFVWCQPRFSRSPRASFSGRGSARASGITPSLGRPIARSRTGTPEGGFLLALLLPILALLGAFVLGTIRFTERSQARAALQARLDVCAVRLATARERFYARLAKANEGVEDTKLGIYALRAAALLPGAGEAAIAGQEVLLELNATLATAEDALWAEAAAEEAIRLRCAPTNYSSDAAACLVSPPLAGALERQTTLFFDVKGTLAHRAKGNSVLARVRCSGLTHFVTTKLEIRGDSAVRRFEGYKDVYLYTP